VWKNWLPVLGSRRKLLAAGVAFAALALGIALVVINLAGAEEGDDEGPLLFSDRTQLSICLDGAAGYETNDTDAQAVRQGIEETLATSPIEVPREYAEWELVEGCPHPAPNLTGQRGLSEIFANGSIGGLISEPSPYRLFVFLLPSELYANDPLIARAQLPYILGSGETICETDLCDNLSRAVYLPANASKGALREALLAGLYLLPYTTPEPEPTFDRQGCEQGTPGLRGCSRYLACKTPRPDDNCREVLEDLGVGSEDSSP